MILKLVGITINPEEHTNLGRIDNVMETASAVYIMEFKMDSAQAALEQIKEKKYYEKYLGHKKDIILIGTGFDAENRNIGDYLIEKL